MALDTSHLLSVYDFVTRFHEHFIRLHALVLNAGINTFGLTTATARTSEGYDMCFATNFLGHYLLTRLLLPTLRSTACAGGLHPARVVCVSSVAHRTLRNAPQWRRVLTHGGCSDPYSQSKLAMLLLASELNRRCAGSGVIAVGVNPGAVASDIWRSMPALLSAVMAPMKRHCFLTPAQCAATSLAAATQKLDWGAGDGGNNTMYLASRWRSCLKPSGPSRACWPPPPQELRVMPRPHRSCGKCATTRLLV